MLFFFMFKKLNWSKNLIEFKGELSTNCKNYILHKEVRLGVIVASTVAIIFLIPTLLLTFLWDWIAIFAILPLIMLVLFSLVRPTKKSYGIILPTRIKIESDIIISEGDKFSYECPLNEVKYIVDYGEWYHIFFNYKYRNQRFVCQKDLLVEGSIEDFDKIFAGKIIKYNKGMK